MSELLSVVEQRLHHHFGAFLRYINDTKKCGNGLCAKNVLLAFSLSHCQNIFAHFQPFSSSLFFRNCAEFLAFLPWLNCLKLVVSGQSLLVRRRIVIFISSLSNDEAVFAFLPIDLWPEVRSKVRRKERPKVSPHRGHHSYRADLEHPAGRSSSGPVRAPWAGAKAVRPSGANGAGFVIHAVADPSLNRSSRTVISWMF